MYVLSYLIFFSPLLIAASQTVGEQHALLFKNIAVEEAAQAKKRGKKTAPKKNITIDYTDEALIDVINAIAAKKQINIVLPIKEQLEQLSKCKVTVHLKEKLTLEEAWSFLITLLDFEGYSLIKEADIYEIVKNSKDINREPLPLYIGTEVDQLPDTDQRIRYIYYLSNLKLDPNANKDKKNEVYALLDTLLPQIKDAPNTYLDANTNSIIFSEKSNSIKSAAKVIQYLDQLEIQEKMEFIKLRYLDAKFVADLFNKEITPPVANTYLTNTPASDAGYFSQKLKIMADTKNNALIVLGKTQAIERVKDFIFKYLDAPLDEGHTMLHVYQLQYLDAGDFAPILERVVKNESKKSTGQSTTAAGAATEGPERFFGEVIVKSDAPDNKTSEENKYWGGNKLVIACSGEDWKRIKQLIEELDIPQAQVVIEVLIAELTSKQTRQLGSMLRNPACFPFPRNMNAQSAQLTGVITDATQAGVSPAITPPTTIQADLLGNVLVPASASGSTAGVSLANPSYTQAGTSMLAISDKSTGSVWNILEILDFLTWENIITNPHVIAMNNVQTEILAKQSRFLIDRAANTAGSGATEIVNKWIDAPVVVKVTPRISSANTVNLNLDISIDEFNTPSSQVDTQNPTQQTRATRKLQTNANVASGDILTLGGLTRHDDSDNVTRTPVLGQLPIIGYLFKNRSKTESETSLTVFICPTIIQPRLRSGISTYTNDYVKISKDYIQEGGLFESLRDPITRWFFTNVENNPIQDVDDFMNEDVVRRKESFIPQLAEQEIKTQDEYRVIGGEFSSQNALNSPKPVDNKSLVAQATDESQTRIVASQEPTRSPIRTSIMSLAKNERNREADTENPTAQIKEMYKNLHNPLLRS